MRRTLSAALAAVAAMLVAAGCGGGGKHPPSPTPPPAPQKTFRVCSGLTDKCRTITAPVNGGQYRDRLIPRLTIGARRGCHIVDVSDFQGLPDWGRIAPFICGGVAKMGEGGSYSLGGSSFFHNWTGLAASHRWHSGYWFLRGNVPCSTTGPLIVSRLRAVHYETDLSAGPFQLDVEVPGANGNGTLVPCLDGYVYRAFHRHVGVYTAPGTWPGGSHSTGGRNFHLWQAEYGSILHPFWQPVVAWQCTDGHFGCVTFVPGIGFDDVSLNFGLIDEHGAPPLDPYRHYPKPVRNFRVGKNIVRASEYATVKAWDAARCTNPPKRYACRVAHYHMRLLIHRIDFLASDAYVHGHWVKLKKARWNVPANYPLGIRHAGISRRIDH